MKVNVIIERTKKKLALNLPEEATIADVAKAAKLNIVEVLPVKNGKIITEDAVVRNKDIIEFLSVVSGG